MKKFLVFLVCVFMVAGAFATGENVPTSQSFVDSAISQKQDTIPANNGTAQVLTNTGTLGAVGTKNIYDASGAYAEQTDGLITAGDFNAAVQNAINAEFVCIEWNANGECLLMDIRGTPAQSILPNGYTALEYLVSDGQECILTNIAWSNVYGFRGRAQQNIIHPTNKSIFGSNSSKYDAMYGTYYDSATNQKYWYWAPSISYLNIAEFNFTRISDTNKWSGTVNNVNSEPGNIIVSSGVNVRILCTGNPERWFPGNVWYLQLFNQNGEFLLNAIPARRDSDGLIGFYDLVSNQMLTNSGTGEFIAGPVASLYIPQGN